MPLFECLSFLISLFSCFWHPWVKRPPLYDNSYSPRSHWPPFYHNMPLGGKLWAKARVCRTIRWGALSKTSEQNQVLCRTESSPKKKEHRSGTTRQFIRNSRSDILLRLDPVPRHTVLVWSCLLISWSWISLLFFLFTPPSFHYSFLILNFISLMYLPFLMYLPVVMEKGRIASG